MCRGEQHVAVGQRPFSRMIRGVFTRRLRRMVRRRGSGRPRRNLAELGQSLERVIRARRRGGNRSLVVAGTNTKGCRRSAPAQAILERFVAARRRTPACPSTPGHPRRSRRHAHEGQVSAVDLLTLANSLRAWSRTACRQSAQIRICRFPGSPAPRVAGQKEAHEARDQQRGLRRRSECVDDESLHCFSLCSCLFSTRILASDGKEKSTQRSRVAIPPFEYVASREGRTHAPRRAEESKHSWSIKAPARAAAKRARPIGATGIGRHDAKYLSFENGQSSATQGRRL